MNTMNQIAAQKSIQKLASGMRINQASDDAAGLAISEKMRGQIRGLDQASRNIQDSISMIQTAEGGLQEIHSLLQRGRELSVQAANGTLTDSDRQSIQKEIDQITKEIDRIANTTEFNTIKLLNAVSGADSAEKAKAIEALQKSWLQQSEQLISTHYGLTADGATLEIVFVPDSGDDALAWVQGSYFMAGPDGRYFNQKLYIDMSDFTPVTWPNGGGSFISNDRIIAHEMVHAVMGRTTNFRDLPTWFKEGTAEFIHGADERLKGDIAAAGSIANLLSQASLSGGWIGDSKHYSTAYAAVKYLDSKVAGGIKTIMQDIKLANLGGGNEKTLEQAIIDNTTYSS
jgi:flagellin